MEIEKRARSLTVALVLYFMMLVVFLLAGLYPSDRVWGVNWWAYFPGYVPWLLVAVGGMAGLLLTYSKGKGRARDELNTGEEVKDRRYLIWSIAFVIVSALLFYIFRVRTHFLGDGYGLLTQLEKDIHLIKFTGWGESWLHIQLQELIGGDSTSSAIASFRIFAIAAGTILAAAVLAISRTLFESNRARLLFSACLLTGGYMLLYFGYVEYYSGLVAATMVYCLLGLVVAAGLRPRWWLLPALAAAVFFHVFALTLLPGAVYLLVSGTAAGRRLAVLKWPVKAAIGLVLVIGFGWLFSWFYNDNFFFRLSILTLVEDQFTLEGYTLFSWLHLVDFANLMLLFVPALPLAAVAVFSGEKRSMFKRKDVRFLIITVVCTLGTAFVLDPNYGMPRDWDLFTFAAPPLAVLVFWWVFKSRAFSVDVGRAAALAIVLGLLMLGPRVASQIIGEVSVAHFESYIHRNFQVEKDGRIFLKEYFHRTGDYVAEVEQRLLWEDLAMDSRLIMQGDDLFDAGDFGRAMYLYRQALGYNPVSSLAYTNIGTCFQRAGQYDSALYYQRIANAINPYNASILNNLGLAYFYREEYDKSEEAWYEALLRDSTLIWPRVFLTRQYYLLGDSVRYESLLLETAAREDAPAELLRQLGTYYIRREKYDKAVEALQRGLEAGLDSNAVRQLQSEYPNLEVVPD